jgi:hypothetical protein
MDVTAFNDPNQVHLYGMPPNEWYARGVRIRAQLP